MIKSRYNKIYEVTKLANRPPLTSKKEDLIRRVYEEGLEAFQGWFYDPELDEMIEAQSESSIKQTVHLAIDIGLVDPIGCPTKSGTRCINLEKFRAQIDLLATSKLAEYGVTIERLNSITEDALKHGLVNFPTSTYLYENCGSDIPKARFLRYLSLLEGAGSVEVSRKKLYLTFS
ncbi:MAG: hypothetical protein AAF431_10470 [Pseudomonadota bacterium]